MEKFHSVFLGSLGQNVRGGSGGLVVYRVSGECAPAFGVVRDV